MANEVLGHATCYGKACSEKVEVLQAKRNGAHLYYRCPSCGLNQGTGKPLQNYLYYKTEWLGEPPTAPTNVGEPPESTESVTVESTEKPTEQTDPKPTKKSGKSGLLWALGTIALIAIGIGVKSA